MEKEHESNQARVGADEEKRVLLQSQGVLRVRGGARGDALLESLDESMDEVDAAPDGADLESCDGRVGGVSLLACIGSDVSTRLARRRSSSRSRLIETFVNTR